MTWKTGHNLNAFNDILRGGFGVHEYEESIVLVWEKFLKSKSDLGYSETVKHYQKMIKTCHHSNIPSVKQFLKDAEKKTGETLFDLIIEIINDHEHITLVIR